MSYKLVNMWVPRSKYNIKAPYSMSPIGICIHETDNNATARNEASYMARNNMYVSWHVAVDENEVVQTLPFNRNGWAAGDGANGVGNRRYIHIEICRNKDNGYAGAASSRLMQSYENAAIYTAHVLRQYGWTTSVLRQHYDFTRKNCPRKIRLHGRWNWFKGRVQHHMDRLAGRNVSTPKVEAKPATPKPKAKESPKLNLKVALKDLKLEKNQYGTEIVEVKGKFKVGNQRIRSRVGSPNIKHNSKGHVAAGTTVEFSAIALAGDYAWVRFLDKDSVTSWLPFATKAGFMKEEYWGEFL